MSDEGLREFGASASPSYFGLGTAITSAMAVAMLAQFSFGALGPLLVNELSLSKTSLGSLSTVFFISGATCSVLAGSIVDKAGTHRVLIGLFAVEVIAFVVMAGFPTYAGLAVGAVIAGWGSAAGNPVTNRLVMEHLEEGSRGLIMGVKQSGAWGGAILSGLLLPPVAASYGLRAAFFGCVLLACLGMAHAVIAFPVAQFHAAPVSESTNTGGSLGPIRWLVPYAFCMGAGASAVTTFLAVYAYERVGLTQLRAGATLAVLGGTGVIGRLAWGWVAERARSVQGPLTLIAILSVASQLLLVAASLAGEWLLWIAVASLGLTAMAWNVIGMMSIVRISDVSVAGRASGMVMTGFFLGLLLSPVVLGLLADTSGSYIAGWFVTAGLFAASGAISSSRGALRRTDPTTPRHFGEG